MKKTILFLLIFLLNGAIMGHQKMHQYTLNNGLQVFLVQDPSASLASVRTYIKAGSVTEGQYLGSGISHYVEHLVAGGSTKKKPEDSYKNQIAHLGGAFNAYTTKDHTSYFINTIPDNINTAIDMLYEWMFFCSFDKSEVAREQEVITREIEKNDANISRLFYNFCQSNFYHYNPYRLPIIGYLDNFNKISRKDLINYYSNFYVPGNMVLVVGGNFNETSVIEYIKKTFGTITPKAPPTQAVFEEPYPFTSRTLERTGNTTTTYFSVRFATIDIFSDDLYALDLLDFVLGNGEDSILQKILVDDEKLAYGVDCASFTPTITTGYFDITFETDYENIPKLKARLNKIISDIKNGKLDHKKVERAKKQKLAEDILSHTTIDERTNRVGLAYVYGGAADFFEKYIENFKHTSCSDVIEAANDYLIFDKAVYSILGPEKVPGPKTATENKLKNPAIKTIDETILKNGVRILFQPDLNIDGVYARVLIAGGKRSENETNNGVTHLVASLLDKGSKKYSKARIDRIIEDHGASLYGSMGNNTIYYSLICLEDDFMTLLPVFTHTFLNPTFPEKEIEEDKRLIKQSISKRKDDWFRYGSYTSKKVFYEGHPYGLASNGEIETIKTLTQKDIKKHYKSLITPENIIISIFGNFNKAKTLSHIKKQFSSLKTPSSAFNFYNDIERETHKKQKQVAFDIPQDVAGIFVFFDGEKYKNISKTIRLNLVDAVLSGMNYPSGRLHNILREKGYVYMVHGSNQPGVEKGHFAIYALSSPDKIDKVKKVIQDQIKDIKTNPITQEEFDQAIAQMKYYYKDQIDAPDDFSLIAATNALYGKGHNFHTKIDQLLDELTIEDVQNTAKEYLVNPQIYIFK